MTLTTDGKQQSAFSRWLRTGRLPSTQFSEGVEFKFNPWHDPEDGRFTSAGSGRYFGEGAARPAMRAPQGNPQRWQIATRPKAEKPRTGLPANSGKRSGDGGATGIHTKPASQLGGQPSSAAELAGGFGEGLYGVAKGTVETVYSVLTTNPIVTVHEAGGQIAKMIDGAIAAEDTPARIQVSRTVNAVANASPRDIGRAIGSVAGNVALGAVPGAALGKVSALRRARNAVPRITYDPPEIGWVKENLGKDSPAKRYNDAATGARPGQAPTLMRTMPDGSKRPVKFDGVQGEYVIDRKFKIVNAPRARAQLLRQSRVLTEHKLIGIWEVPNEKQKIAALKLLAEINIANIKVRVVKP